MSMNPAPVIQVQKGTVVTVDARGVITESFITKDGFFGFTMWCPPVMPWDVLSGSGICSICGCLYVGSELRPEDMKGCDKPGWVCPDPTCKGLS